MHESHEPYKALLEQLRADPAALDAVLFHEERDAEGNWQDPNYSSRFGVLRCLQFDLQPEDHAVVRLLFTEEIAARSADPWSGESWALELAAYLLATFQKPEDLNLFWRAKTANFDTYCGGFDARYMLVVGKDIQAVRALLEADSQFNRETREALEEVLSRNTHLTPQDIAGWWERRQHIHPMDLEQESPWQRFEAARHLRDFETARYWLRLHAAYPPANPNASYWQDLAYEWASVGEYDAAYHAAMEHAKELRRSGEEEWEICSAQCTAADFATKAGKYQEALTLLEAQVLIVEQGLPGAPGMPRGVAGSLFDLASAAYTTGETSLAHRAFDTGDRLASVRTDLSLSVFQKAETVARSLGNTLATELYAKRAAAEEKRINRRSRKLSAVRKPRSGRRM